VNANQNLLTRVLSTRVLAKAILTFDRATAIVVGSCWAAALLVMFMALHEVHSAATARREAQEALAAEPVLPTITTGVVNAREGQAILDRLQHQFPELKITWENNQTLSIRTMEGSRFHQWVTAISYVDAMAPQIHWSLQEFCVGHCDSDLMRATLTGQKISFALPHRAQP